MENENLSKKGSKKKNYQKPKIKSEKILEAGLGATCNGTTNGSIITKKSWQEGNSCTFSIEESGLGDVESDYLEEQIEYRQRPANDYLIDEDSNYLLDEDDNALID
jgi:hypothetical protein